MPTARMKPISLFVPFERIERREEDDALIVEGYAFCNEVVPGDPRKLLRSAMVAATADYMRNGGGVVREMHQPIAAGIAHEATWDDRGCRLRAEIVDPVAKLKIEKKVYRGFSVGVNPRASNPAQEVELAEWVETSLVDRPKDPGALFLYRADGFDPDAEVEVEILDGSPAPPPDRDPLSHPVVALTPSPESDGESLAEAPVAAGVSAVSPSSSDEPPSQDLAAQAGAEPDGEALSSPEERVQTSATTSFGTNTVAVTPEENVQIIAREAERFMRAQTSATVPARENLEGKPKRPMGDAEIERYIKHKDGKWRVYSESGRKLGEHDTREEAVAQLQAIEIEKRKDEKGATKPKERGMGDEKKRGAWIEAERKLIATMMRLAKDDPEFADPRLARWAVLDVPAGGVMLSDRDDADFAEYHSTHELAETRIADLILMERVGLLAPPADVEPPAPSAPNTQDPRPNTQVSPSDEGDALTRLAIVQAAHEEALTRLAAVTGERDGLQAEVTRLSATAAEQKRLLDQPRDVPPARFTVQGIAREFLANAVEREAADTAALQKRYDETKALAAKEPDFGRRRQLVVDMGHIQTQLAQRGVKVD